MTVTKEELGKRYPVQLVDYDPAWPQLFDKEKRELLRILGPALALRIEHIGSTAVPGMKAKPTVDILVEIPKTGRRDDIIPIMTRNGYIHMEEQQRHLMFVKGYAPTGLEKESYHVHMGPGDQGWLWDRVYFRDYLGAHGDAARRYENLKIDLASRYTNDREAYTESKGALISEITALARKELLRL